MTNTSGRTTRKKRRRTTSGASSVFPALKRSTSSWPHRVIDLSATPFFLRVPVINTMYGWGNRFHQGDAHGT